MEEFDLADVREFALAIPLEDEEGEDELECAGGDERAEPGPEEPAPDAFLGDPREGRPPAEDTAREAEEDDEPLELIVDVRAFPVGENRIRLAEPVSAGGDLLGIQFSVGDVLEVEARDDDVLRVVRVVVRSRTWNLLWYGVPRDLIWDPGVAEVLERLVSPRMCWEYSLGTILFQRILDDGEQTVPPEVDADLRALDAALRRAGWSGFFDGGRMEPGAHEEEPGDREGEAPALDS